MWERRSSAGESSERLAARRRRNRRRLHILFCFVLVLLGAGFIWLTWQPSVRIADIAVSTGDPQILVLAKQELAGTYAHVLPRDSFFFTPEQAIRAAILAARPDVQAVSISHQGLTGLAVVPDERVAVARWCGLALTPGVEQYCYLFDASGYIFAAADASSSTPLSSFVLYDALAASTTDPSRQGSEAEPLRATLAHARELPAAFDFARKVGMFGSSVASITIQGDEVTDTLASGTELIYVLGQEEQAMNDLVSAKADLTLSDGSALYIDLRFPGKVYAKKKDDTVSR